MVALFVYFFSQYFIYNLHHLHNRKFFSPLLSWNGHDYRPKYIDEKCKMREHCESFRIMKSLSIRLNVSNMKVAHFSTYFENHIKVQECSRIIRMLRFAFFLNPRITEHTISFIPSKEIFKL